MIWTSALDADAHGVDHDASGWTCAIGTVKAEREETGRR
ncbi:hypothetical protein QO011_008229 [Labrys wisconsinensis]|uniref:Uncharacterized protein n=1 Tax=Labrys wisconsinensis TaxID=425677 RepID=A0ABU0JPW0_9HYPH|nr:hypothetical protein [Labrys wisconsinensis]